MRFASLLLIAFLRLAAAAGIENAVCEQTGPASYRIAFEAPPGTGDISIYASFSADAIDSPKPILTTRTSPVNVEFSSGRRVYFHLKPPRGPTRVVSIRRMPLEGNRNFRDLGGYRTADGRYVRWGKLYRSDKLDLLTPADYQYVEYLGLSLVCDFRLNWEREAAPTRWLGGNPKPEILPNAVDSRTLGKYPDGLDPNRPGQSGASAAAAPAAEQYRYMALEPILQYGLMLRRLAQGNLPALYHCMSGRNRTGVFTAILLAALGVPRETVREDYLLSNQYFTSDSSLPQLTAEYMQRNNLAAPPDAFTVKRAMGADDPKYLDIVFQTIGEKYKTFDAFLIQGLKLTRSEVAALRNRLLQP